MNRSIRYAKVSIAGGAGGASGYAAGGGGRRHGGRSVFEEINEPVPQQFSLPPDNALTIFDIPLLAYQSRPWETPNINVSQYFNFGLDPVKWAQYADRQVRIRSELKVLKELKTIGSRGGGDGNGGGSGGGGGEGEGNGEGEGGLDGGGGSTTNSSSPTKPSSTQINNEDNVN
jgi:hypothetical protein